MDKHGCSFLSLCTTEPNSEINNLSNFFVIQKEFKGVNRK